MSGNGNYVALKCETNAFEVTGIDKAMLGEFDPHITLIYSPETTFRHNDVENFVAGMAAYKLIQGRELKPVRVDMFGDPVKGYSVVLIMEHGCLNYINKMLVIKGMKHTFDEYHAHLSLTYKTPEATATELKHIVELVLDKIKITPVGIIAEDAM